jgi:hypothetical protein
MKFIVIILLLVSCSSKKITPEVETVSIQKPNNKSLKIDTSLEIDEVFEPKADLPSEVEIKSVKSLTIYSTLYSSLGLVEFFKRSEKKKHHFKVITANGFASIVSVLYAKKESASLLEWKLFELLKQIKGHIPFSKPWKRKIRSFMVKEFGSQTLDKLAVQVGIPEYNEENEITLSLKGGIVDNVMGSLDMGSSKAFYIRPIHYRGPLNMLNVDIKYQLSFVPSKFNFKKLEGYTWGIFTSYLSFIQDKPEDLILITTEKKLWIDKINPLSDIIHAYKKSIDDALIKFEEMEKEWKEENTASSINNL